MNLQFMNLPLKILFAQMKSFCSRGGGTEGAKGEPASLPLFAKIINKII